MNTNHLEFLSSLCPDSEKITVIAANGELRLIVTKQKTKPVTIELVSKTEETGQAIVRLSDLYTHKIALNPLESANDDSYDLVASANFIEFIGALGQIKTNNRVSKAVLTPSGVLTISGKFAPIKYVTTRGHSIALPPLVSNTLVDYYDALFMEIPPMDLISIYLGGNKVKIQGGSIRIIYKP